MDLLSVSLLSLFDYLCLYLSVCFVVALSLSLSLSLSLHLCSPPPLPLFYLIKITLFVDDKSSNIAKGFL